MDTALLRCAVIGAGRIGQIHATNLAQRIPGASVVSITDVNRDAAATLAARLNVARVETDPHAAIGQPDVDAVIVCSPTNTHYDVIMAAVAHGRAIFTEKPIDLALDRIDALNAAVADRGLPFMVGFQRRFDPDFARIRDVVREGRIGDVHLVRISSRDAVPPPESFIPTSGGLFLDMTVHDLDMVRFVTGSEVTSVHTVATVLVDPMFTRHGDFDTAVITLTLANGALATIDNSRRAVYGQDQRVEVFGSGGVVSAPNHVVDRVVYADASGSHGARLMSFFPERYGDAYRIELQAFVDAVRSGSPAAVTGEDGRRAVAIGLAVLESARTGRTVAL